MNKPPIQLLALILIVQATYSTNQTVVEVKPRTTFKAEQSPHTSALYKSTVICLTTHLASVTLIPSLVGYQNIFMLMADSLEETTVTDRPANISRCEVKGPTTCLFNSSKANPTIYLRVQTGLQTSYTLSFSSVSQIYEAEVGGKFMYNFEEDQFRLYSVNVGALKSLYGASEVTFVMQYYLTGVLQVRKPFRAVAAINIIPNLDHSASVYSLSAGVDRQVLTLQALSVDSTYYILISSQNSNPLNGEVIITRPPSLEVGYDVTHYASQQTKYVTNLIEHTQNLILEMDIFGGDGQIYLEYCSQLLTIEFYQAYGCRGSLYFSPYLRQACLSRSINNTNSADTILTTVSPVMSITYSLSIYEDDSSEEDLSQYNKIYSIFTADHTTATHTFVYDPHLNYHIDVALQTQKFNPHVSKLSVSRYLCYDQGKSNCSVQTVNQTISKQFFIYDPNSVSCYVTVSVNQWKDYPQTVLLYSFTLTPYPTPHQLQVNQKVTEQVRHNQDKCFIINLQQMKKINQWDFQEAQVVISLAVINGFATMFASKSIQCPLTSNQAAQDPSVIIAQDGYLAMSIDSSDTLINIDVSGVQTSIYDLSFEVITFGSEESGLVLLQDNKPVTLKPDNKNNYTLLKYEPHILPYFLRLFSTPQCIRYGPQLHLSNEECVLPPSQPLSMPIIFINISYNSTIKLQISLQHYMLSENNPLWINCEFKCWTLVSVMLSQSSAVVHRGSGNIIYQNDNHFGKLSLQCQDYPCVKIFNATLGANSMFLWLDTDRMMLTGSYAKTITLERQHYLIYQVKQWDLHNYIMVLTQSQKVKAFYDIKSNYILQKNVQTLAFPHYYTPNMQQGNPLKDVFIISIPHKQLAAFNCTMSNQVRCVVTIRLVPDDTMPYDSSVSNPEIVVSANAHAQNLMLEQPRQMEETAGPSIVYFTASIPDNQNLSIRNYTVSSKPLTDCSNAIYSSEQSLNHDTPSYGQATIAPIDGALYFTVVTTRKCLFTVFASVISSPLMIANYMQSFQTGRQKGLNLLYKSQTSSFTLIINPQEIGITTIQIMVNKVNQAGQYDIPNLNKADYKNSGSNNMTIPDSIVGGMYDIEIVMPEYTAFEVMIRIQGHVYLKNGQQFKGGHWKLAEDPEKLEQYELRQEQSWSLIINSNSYIRAAVYDFKQTLLNETTTEPTDYTSVNFLPQAQITRYNIDITLLGDSTDRNYILLYYESVYRQLFNGVVTNDVLQHKHDRKCYQYSTDSKNSQDDAISISIIFQQNVGQSVILTASANGQMLIIALLDFTSATAVSQTVKFEPYSKYEICLEAIGLSCANKPYKLLLQNSPTDSTLLPSSPSTISTPETIEQYQLINSADTPALVTLTPCQDIQTMQYQILSYQNYHQMTTNHTQSTNVERVSTPASLYAKLTPSSQGYLYLGVESLQKAAYRIDNQPIQQDQLIRAIEWDLPDRNIGEVTTNPIGQVEVSLPVVTTSTNSTSPITITYSVYLADLEQYSGSSPIDTQVRCPQLYHRSNTIHEQQQNGLKIQTETQHYSIPMIFFTPTLTFPTALPDRYNLTAKATIVTHGQTIEHYYSVRTSEDGSSSSGSRHPLYFSIVAVIIIAGCTALFLYRRIKSKKDKNSGQDREGETTDMAKSVEMREPAQKQVRREVNVDLLGGEQIMPQQTKKADKKGYQEMIEQF